MSNLVDELNEATFKAIKSRAKTPPKYVPLEETSITNPFQLNSSITPKPSSIKIVSIQDAAAYHQVSEKSIYLAISQGKLQFVKGIPEHQLDNYQPDRVNQSRGKKPKVNRKVLPVESIEP